MFKFVIDEVAATSELVLMLVDVELVIVPFATSIAGRERLVSERLVIVALVNVAFVEVRYEVEAVKRFAVSELVVEAFVVDAFKTAKLAVVPKSVPIVAEVKLAMAAYNELKMFKFVIEDVAATSELVLMFVEVELVTVPFVEFKLVRFPVVPVI